MPGIRPLAISSIALNCHKKTDRFLHPNASVLVSKNVMSEYHGKFDKPPVFVERRR
jgi:hypothetical protein